MTRNKNVDVLRALAIIIIVAYHTYVLGGYPWANHVNLNYLISFFGELGVTLFFLLSGYGIYSSLNKKEMNGSFPSWLGFMKGRCRRIIPPYYICIIFLLIFQTYTLIGSEGWPTIVAYFCFAQNFFVSTHGAINGALWALATIFQFYLIAPFLYKLLKKNWIITAVVSILISVLSKFVIYHYLLKGAEGTYYFVYGRQLIAALDNFVLGMVAALLAEKVLRSKKNIKPIIGICGTALSGIIVLITCYTLSKHGIYIDDVVGYTTHTILSVLLMMLIFFVSILPCVELKIYKVSDWIAANQYGIYLWHMPMIFTLGSGAGAFLFFKERCFAVYMLLILLVSIFIGGFYSVGINKIFKK
ncbi:MAG: acyltransferase [Candidatus Alectryocaccobium sp.]|nr:acyltransferase [Candidatus Alectryocaccobium sp.]